MFENLSSRLTTTLNALRGAGRLTEDQVKQASRELRMALLEADVALPVVREFIAKVRERAVGSEISGSMAPGQALLKIVQEELVAALGGSQVELDLRAQPPAVILMAGLQGAGKTTTVGKLARWLRTKQNKKVLVVSADVYRPAAIEQLRVVAKQVEVECLPSEVGQNPVDIAKAALAEARKQYADILIVDSAGRTSVDQAMMDEIAALHAALEPAETLFVVDAMTGQDAANTAKAFAERLTLTGVVLTKVDGDSRGGAALSVRTVTGAPIKFLGVGEKPDAFEAFHPDRIAARILGQGDVLSLIEETSGKLDHEKAKKFADKLRTSKRFDLEDFREQMQQMAGMGDMQSLLAKLPGGAQLQAQVAQQNPEQQIRRSLAIINSMTAKERRQPELIKASRKRRIAGGSGMQVQDVNRLLKQFEQSRKMMKKFAGGGMAKLMRSLGGGAGLAGLKRPPGR